MAELLALFTPLVAAGAFFVMKPDADPAMRARVASGVLFASGMASWSRAGEEGANEEVELPTGDIIEVPPVEYMGGALGIELVAVSLDRREVSLSGTAWPVPEGIDFREEMANICRGAYVALASEQSLVSVYGCLAEEEKAIQKALGDDNPICQALTADRSWWLVDIPSDKPAVRAKVNVFNAIARLAKARHRVNIEAAELLAARPWQERTVRASTAIVRTMSSAIGTKKTIGLLDTIEVSTPKGATLALFGAHGPGKESLAERLAIMKPRVLKTYLATMMAAFDQGNPDLSFMFNVEECAEEYWGDSGGRLRGEIQASLDVLQAIDVVAAGKWRASKGQTQHLINRINNGKTQRFEHCFLMRAALGCYAHVDDSQKETMKAMAPKTEMVQFPRAIMRANEQAFPLAIGAALLVRDSLTQLRKTGEIVHSPAYFLASLGRADAARKRGAKAEIAYAEKVLDESEIGTIEVMPDGRIKTHVSALLVEAYGSTIKGAARAAKSAAKKHQKEPSRQWVRH